MSVVDAAVPFTVVVIGKRAGAEMVTLKFSSVGTCKQTPEFFGTERVRSMPFGSDASLVREAFADTFVHAFGASTEPKIVCTPFL